MPFSDLEDSLRMFDIVIQKIKHTQAILNLAVFLDALVTRFITWLLVVSAIIVVTKLLGINQFCEIEYLLLTFIPVIVLAVYSYRKSKFSFYYTATWLDLKEKAGGTYIATVKDNIDIKPVKKIDINAGIKLPGYFKQVVLPLFIFCVALAVPGIQNEIKESGKAVKKKLEVVQKRMETLKEQKLLSDDEIFKLQEAFEQAAIGVDKKTEVAMEGIDHLQNNIEQSIMEKARTEMESLKVAQKALNDILSKSPTIDNGSALDRNDLENLANALKKSSENSNNPFELDSDLQEILDKLDCNSCSALNAGMLARLSNKDLKRLADCLKKKMYG